MIRFFLILLWAFPVYATFNSGRLDLFGQELSMKDNADQTYECTDYEAIQGKTITNLDTLTGALCHLSAPRSGISDYLKKIYQAVGRKQYCEQKGLNENSAVKNKDKITFEAWQAVLSEQDMMFLMPGEQQSNDDIDLYQALFNPLYPNTKVQEVLEGKYAIKMAATPDEHARSVKQNNELKFALNVQAKATVDVAFEKSFQHQTDLANLRQKCQIQKTFRNKIVCDLMYQTLTAQMMNEALNISGAFSGTESSRIFKGTTQ